MLTVRNLIKRLLDRYSSVTLDCPATVRILKRDKDNVVIESAYVPVAYLTAGGNICIEYADIKWERE